MSYQHTVEQLYALGHELASTPSHKFDLAYVREMLQELGHPERRFASVLIAGTNGKGSTAATLASILRVAGYRTALYSSPHLLRINERIQVNGEMISDAEFGEIHDRVERVAQQLLHSGKLPWHPSFFEMLTAMAFEYFASVGVEIAVLEVGMGGRLDATNVVDPAISVIADISLDHQKYLGDTIAEIAREKAGIIRKHGVVVTLPQHPQANDVIGNAIVENDARGVSAAKYVPPVSPGAAAYLGGRTLLCRAEAAIRSRSWARRLKSIRRWQDGISCAISRWRLRPRKSWDILDSRSRQSRWSKAFARRTGRDASRCFHRRQRRISGRWCLM
jgi:dihydrofolate synthase / folylpolyglutamate synthase